MTHPLKALFDKAVSAAACTGRLHRLGEARLALPATLRDFAGVALQCASASGGFTVKEFRDASGVGRNPCIDVLEYFDQLRFTRRDGQKRTIVDPDLPENRFSG